jgi:YjbE family integral membrane protein
MLGVAIAVVFLIGFALVATQLLKVTGLLLAGGLLLMWVAYNMFRELRPGAQVTADDPDTAGVEGPPATKTFLQAAVQITLADLSMSLDNVLAVAAAARDHPSVLFVGLVLSVTFMGIAASFVARLIHRFPLLAWAGLLMILYVALKMIWEGWHDVAPLLA